MDSCGNVIVRPSSPRFKESRFSNPPLAFFDEYGYPRSILVCGAISQHRTIADDGVTRTIEYLPIVTKCPGERDAEIERLQDVICDEVRRGIIGQHDGDLLVDALEIEKSICCLTPHYTVSCGVVSMMFLVVTGIAVSFAYIGHMEGGTGGEVALWSVVVLFSALSFWALVPALKRCYVRAALTHREDRFVRVKIDPR
ncbi:MAG: hypothetical protein LBC42_03205 [Puniceicoccales bacterium]|jgi:hypothetical protein|nr:hypothetical protein [Puniceicoccales bacterium]